MKLKVNVTGVEREQTEHLFLYSQKDPYYQFSHKGKFMGCLIMDDLGVVLNCGIAFLACDICVAAFKFGN